MSFFKKVKDYIFGEDLVDSASYQPSSSRPEGGSSGWGAGPDVRAKAAAARAVAAAAARERAREVPILQDAHPEVGGGIQGLQWYKYRMQEDADGDLAHQFLSEPPAPPPQQEPRRPRSGRERPLPPLQTQRARLRQTGAAEMIVEQGNVYVVPVT